MSLLNTIGNALGRFINPSPSSTFPMTPPTFGNNGGNTALGSALNIGSGLGSIAGSALSGINLGGLPVGQMIANPASLKSFFTSPAGVLSGVTAAATLSGVGIAGLAGAIGAPAVVTGFLSSLGGALGMSSVFGSTALGGASLGAGAGTAGLGGAGLSAGGALGSLSGFVTSAAGFLATNPVGWAILGAVGIFAAFKIFGSKLKKAKKNFNKMRDMIKQQLAMQGITGQNAENIASQLAFDSLSSKDQERLKKTAAKNPNGESAQILKAAGYNTSTGMRQTDFLATFQSTGKTVADFTLPYYSDANLTEKNAAATELAKIPQKQIILSDGSVKNVPDFKAYFANSFASLTLDQIKAELEKRGYVVDINELKDRNGQITSESFESYIISEVDQKNIFQKGAMRSDGYVSSEEFADLFIQPSQADWNDHDAGFNLGEFFKLYKQTDSTGFDNFLTKIKETQKTNFSVPSNNALGNFNTPQFQQNKP